MNPWTPLCASADLEPGGRKLHREGRLAIALFRDEDGSLHALDNRCPHEGYPLLEGPRRDGVLTCPWHNYKFRLADGRCVQGDEDARRYPVRESDGRIEADLSPQPGELERRWRALDEATLDGRLAQVARELARLLDAGVSASALAVHAAALDARHGEYGSSHALPVAADVVKLLDETELDPVLALMHPYELVAEGHRRRPAHRLPEPRPGDVLAEIEREELPAALASARALLRESGWSALRERLHRAACEHFLSFGHPMIYIDKLDELIAHADAESGEEIALGLVRNVVLATREDLLPPMKEVRLHLESGFPATAKGYAGGAKLGDHAAILRDRILGGDSSWIAAMDQALREGASAEEILDLLVRCASVRLLQFDESIHDRVDLQDDWLDLSHGLSFAHALRPLCREDVSADLLRSLFHAAHFLARTVRLCTVDHISLGPALAYEPAQLAAAIDAGDWRTSLGLARGALESGRLDDLRLELNRWAFAASATRPIYVAHVVKMLRVAFEESARLGDPLPLAGTLRFALLPKRERNVAAFAHDARRFVQEGKLPRRLAS